MPRFLLWVWRAAGRVAAPILYAKSKKAAVVATLTLLGLGAWLLRAVPEFQRWLVSDWTHLVFAGTTVLFLAAFVALCGVEKQLADAETVLLLSPSRTAIFRSACVVTLESSEQSTMHDVLSVQVVGKLQNNGPHPRHVLTPTVELLEKRGMLGHAKVPFELLPGPGQGLQWQCHGARYVRGDFVVPELHQVDFIVVASGTSPGGAAAFLRKELKLRVTIGVVGQPRPTVSEGPLTVVKDPPAPPVDPPSAAA